MLHRKVLFLNMHDGIQKFSQELNGSFVRSVSARNKIVLIAGGLTEIREGSLNAERLYNHLLHGMSSTKPIKNSAFSEFEKKLELRAGTEDDINIPTAIPTKFFKLCEVDTVDSNSIQLICKE